MPVPRPLASYVCRACARSRRIPALSRQYATAFDTRPFRLAVIGSGPAGFYSAYRVMNKLKTAKVDMYEQQITPYGLVRFGVAPDHPEVKNCQQKFEEVAESPNFTYIGNVAVGTQISLAQLKAHYDAIIFAYGASKDKELGIPGENLEGVYSARAFVNWYNGHPDYATLNPRLHIGRDAVIIGQGNVALDVARILLSDVDQLRKTDIAPQALEKLSRSKVRAVRIIGRRGPMQAAFTVKELRELFELPKVGFQPIPPGLLPPPDYKLDRQMKRLSAKLAEGSPNGSPILREGKGWALKFNLSPDSFCALHAPYRISHATFHRNVYVPSDPCTEADPFARDARVAPAPRLDTETFPANIAFRSIGYKAEPLPGLSDIGVPFDPNRGIIPNDVFGRVVGLGDGIAGHDAPIGPVPGMYCAGWVKRGPTGVIASTMNDAFETADAVIADHEREVTFLNGDGAGWDALKDVVVQAGGRPVSWEDWKLIDKVEKDRGRPRGQERIKFVRTEDMLKVLDGGSPRADHDAYYRAKAQKERAMARKTAQTDEEAEYQRTRKERMDKSAAEGRRKAAERKALERKLIAENEAAAENKAEIKARIKAELKAETMAEIMAKIKAENKAETMAEIMAEIMAETKAKDRAEAENETAAENKEDAENEAAAENTAEPENEAAPESKTAEENEAAPENKTAAENEAAAEQQTA